MVLGKFSHSQTCGVVDLRSSDTLCLETVTEGHKRIQFRGEGYRLIADQRLHMFLKSPLLKSLSNLIDIFGKISTFLCHYLSQLVYLDVKYSDFCAILN